MRNRSACSSHGKEMPDFIRLALVGVAREGAHGFTNKHFDFAKTHGVCLTCQEGFLAHVDG